MSLLDDFARLCVLLEKKRTPDGEGGWLPEGWVEGARFLNYQALDTSMEARRAEKEGVHSLYSVLVDKSAPIGYNAYFKDIETGDTYRVTSEPSDKVAPKSASFSLKYFTAEKRALP